jgi:multisubunit Na+/H+ antiporter MnhC subunit
MKRMMGRMDEQKITKQTARITMYIFMLFRFFLLLLIKFHSAHIIIVITIIATATAALLLSEGKRTTERCMHTIKS